MIIGVLALQGAFREHIHMIERCGAKSHPIRLPEELENINGLIIPGGESTTICKLLHAYHFINPIREFALAGKPIFGTCAGAILLADRINGEKRELFNLIDIDIMRNAYGRQIDSREVAITLKLNESEEAFPAIFIRAPIIEDIGPEVIPLACYKDKVVLARHSNILVSTFHPELTSNTKIHAYFLKMASAQNVPARRTP